jgi:Holliday junction resolvasome RuvABC ATP-dependent DNA helicase subunit
MVFVMLHRSMPVAHQLKVGRQGVVKTWMAVIFKREVGERVRIF